MENHIIKIGLDELMWQKRIKNISQLAEKSGISRPTLYRISKGEINKINVSTLISLCNALECQVNDLLVIEKGAE
ncbi:helix-turn-helix transcriptional regulator [Bacillus sp. BRMEA1]|uniref:helix-turn-helix domain-containing protein n=1 Tax=Neobacillus endophyticus TaxID=2738405 RepID=UPI001563C7AD|nr:helix-turn-helix transcriptional regulator [Neobacillus endophyticus]NRD80328.1 helix-turn-helix transcriptional regulator [Neobacillus endophyticus]